jgi:hypothetical protein
MLVALRKTAKATKNDSPKPIMEAEKAPSNTEYLRLFLILSSVPSAIVAPENARLIVYITDLGKLQSASGQGPPARPPRIGPEPLARPARRMPARQPRGRFAAERCGAKPHRPQCVRVEFSCNRRLELSSALTGSSCFNLETLRILAFVPERGDCLEGARGRPTR